MKIINKDNFNKFAYTNIELIKGEAKALIFEFHGLGDGNAMIKEHLKLGRYFAQYNLVYAIPYYNPWGWMNNKSVRYITEVAEAIFDCCGRELPIISTGLSMGGYGALMFSALSKYTPVSCLAICPVCDLKYHFFEREDTARTIYDALCEDWGESDCLEFKDYLLGRSPVSLIEKMPDIPYMIFATTADEEVDYQKHSDIFVKKAKQYGLDVRYIVIPDRAHCDLSTEAVETLKDFIVNAAK